MPSKQQWQENMRLGLYAAAGGPRPKRATIKLKSKCAGRLLVTATTAGNTCSFQLNNYNDPMGTGSTFSGGKTNWHPENHIELLGLGYKRYLVLNSTYRFVVLFRGDESTATVPSDFVVGWWFTKDADNVTWTPGTATTDTFEQMRCCPGFNWRPFAGSHSGGSTFPSQAAVVVHVPRVVSLCKRMNQPSATTALTYQDFTGTLADNTSGSDNLAGYLNFCVFNRYGVEMVASEIQVDCTITQECRFWQPLDANVFPVALDTHA